MQLIPGIMKIFLMLALDVICLKFWSVWRWFAFGVGGYGLLDFDLIILHETTADPNSAELG